MDFFANSDCDSPLESVDSEPEYDGELCCYDVTERGTELLPCAPPAPDSRPPSSGTGGPIPACQTCSLFINNTFVGLPAEPPCPESTAIIDTLLGCMCQGACQTLCGDNVCQGGSASTACFDCATDSAVGCGAQFSACVNDA